jgi:rhomboid family GlyGly-CTERM serine protease
MSYLASLPLKRAQYLPYLCITVAAIICTLFFNSASQLWLSYLPQSVTFSISDISSQFIQLFTRHFVHTNTPHLFINIFGLFLIWLLYGDYFTLKNTSRRFALLFVCLCFFTSVFVAVFSYEDANFVGLSGVLHGLFLWGVVQDIRAKVMTGYLLLLGAIIKIGQEQFYEDSTFMAGVINANVAVDSHLYGAISGLLLGLLIKGRPNR